MLAGEVDRSKLTMRDLIYMNPVDNPMKSVTSRHTISSISEQKAFATLVIYNNVIVCEGLAISGWPSSAKWKAVGQSA